VIYPSIVHFHFHGSSSIQYHHAEENASKNFWNSSA